MKEAVIMSDIIKLIMADNKCLGEGNLLDYFTGS